MFPLLNIMQDEIYCQETHPIAFYSFDFIQENNRYLEIIYLYVCSSFG